MFYSMNITFSETYQQLTECCHQQFGSSIYKQTHRSCIHVKVLLDATLTIL